jgi:glycosyltransferase involved in cell wall biosynthesis
MTARDPVVSVCVPTYNGSAFLDQTLQSIAAQTLQDYEVVVVDDNSTDESVDVARRYAASDPRVRLFEPSQRAGSSARNANRCLRYARGEWIKFLFQDDTMAPHCLSSLLDAMRGGRRFALSWHDYRFEPGVDAETRHFSGLTTSIASVITVSTPQSNNRSIVLGSFGV